jgi:hypothetical protein
MAFQLTWRPRAMMLTVPVWPESGLRARAVRPSFMSTSGIAFYAHERGIHIE